MEIGPMADDPLAHDLAALPNLTANLAQRAAQSADTLGRTVANLVGAVEELGALLGDVAGRLREAERRIGVLERNSTMKDRR
jgi:hypothetical protein